MNAPFSLRHVPDTKEKICCFPTRKVSLMPHVTKYALPNPKELFLQYVDPNGLTGTLGKPTPCRLVSGTIRFYLYPILEELGDGRAFGFQTKRAPFIDLNVDERAPKITFGLENNRPPHTLPRTTRETLENLCNRVLRVLPDLDAIPDSHRLVPENMPVRLFLEGQPIAGLELTCEITLYWEWFIPYEWQRCNIRAEQKRAYQWKQPTRTPEEEERDALCEEVFSALARLAGIG